MGFIYLRAWFYALGFLFRFRAKVSQAAVVAEVASSTLYSQIPMHLSETYPKPYPLNPKQSSRQSSC